MAALKDDGAVVTWGDAGHGGDSSAVAHKGRLRHNAHGLFRISHEERAESLELERARWETHTRRCQLRAEWRRQRWQEGWQDHIAAQGGAREEWQRQRWQEGWRDHIAAQGGAREEWRRQQESGHTRCRPTCRASPPEEAQWPRSRTTVRLSLGAMQATVATAAPWHTKVDYDTMHTDYSESVMKNAQSRWS